jgi:hypothetical protein
MADQGGWLRATHVLQPSQVGVCDLAEGRSPSATLVLGALTVRGLGDVLGHDLRGGYMGGAVVIGALGDPPTVTAPAALGIALQPRGSDAPLDLPPAMAELGFVVRPPAVFADDDVGCGTRCRHRSALA